MTTMTLEAVSRPIIFSTPMVRAILGSRKTQTRRLIPWKAREAGLNLQFSGLDPGFYCSDREASGWVLRSRDGRGTWNDRTYPLHCPSGRTGGRLWVRETWLPFIPEHVVDGKRWAYKADQKPGREAMDSERCREEMGYKWQSPIFMPKEASRISLEVTRVRVQRLQEISEDDAIAEGMMTESLPPDPDNVHPPGSWGYVSGFYPFPKGGIHPTAKEAFREGWEFLHGKGTWDKNPWVWVIDFKRAGGAA